MIRDRAVGAIIGGLIGDALGLGCHWYYDLDELRRHYGDWISDYTTPRPKWYHAGLKAGQLSQTGLITVMLLRSVLEHKGYVESDFTRRLETELFPMLDGTAMQGPGGYTNQSIREAYVRRVMEKKPWSETGGHADNTEAAERSIVLAVRYAKNPRMAAATVSSNCRLTQSNEMIVALGTAFDCVVSLLVAGEKLDSVLSDKLMDLVGKGNLPYQDRPLPPKPGEIDINLPGLFPIPDALLIPSCVARIVNDPGIRIDPAWRIALIYGLPCGINHQLPAAYYLASRFADDFESAVLHAINGGGQNMSRAFLTGALVGAQVGLSKIPQRFIDGLENSNELVSLALELGDLAESD
jgi:ADP-ribosylglycohydrolase